MKNLLILLLSFLPILCFGQNEPKKLIYLDFNFGFLPVEGDFMHGFNISAGHEFTPNLGLGLSLNRAGVIKIEGSRSVFGISLEPRVEYKRWLLTLNGGVVLNAKIDDGSCYGKRKKDANFLFRPSVAYRMGVFSLGMSTTITPNLNFRMHELDEETPSGFCTPPRDYAQPNYDSVYFYFTVGVSFPKTTKN